MGCFRPHLWLMGLVWAVLCGQPVSVERVQQERYLPLWLLLCIHLHVTVPIEGMQEVAFSACCNMCLSTPGQVIIYVVDMILYTIDKLL